MIWKTFLYYWPFVQGIHQSLVDSQHKGTVIQSFDGFLIESLNKPLYKQASCWGNEMSQCSCDVMVHLLRSTHIRHSTVDFWGQDMGVFFREFQVIWVVFFVNSNRYGCFFLWIPRVIYCMHFLLPCFMHNCVMLECFLMKYNCINIMRPDGDKWLGAEKVTSHCLIKWSHGTTMGQCISKHNVGFENDSQMCHQVSI